MKMMGLRLRLLLYLALLVCYNGGASPSKIIYRHYDPRSFIKNIGGLVAKKELRLVGADLERLFASSEPRRHEPQSTLSEFHMKKRLQMAFNERLGDGVVDQILQQLEPTGSKPYFSNQVEGALIQSSCPRESSAAPMMCSNRKNKMEPHQTPDLRYSTRTNNITSTAPHHQSRDRSRKKKKKTRDQQKKKRKRRRRRKKVCQLQSRIMNLVDARKRSMDREWIDSIGDYLNRYHMGLIVVGGSYEDTLTEGRSIGFIADASQGPFSSTHVVNIAHIYTKL